MPEGILAGTPAYWRIDGTGTRRAVMLHCTFAHSGAWKGLASDLSDLFTMEAMDLPGHGRSGGRDPAVSWQAQSVAMTVALIEQGATPVDLFGHSFGATVILRLAVERPDLVRSLTVIEPVFFSAARDANRPEFKVYAEGDEAFKFHLKHGDLTSAAKAFSDRWGGPVKWDDMPEAQRQYMTERIPLVGESGNAALGIGEDYVPLANVAKIDVPVLLIEGAESEPIISGTQVALAEAITGAIRVNITGAGHMAPITHAADTAKAIRNFFVERALL